MAVYDADCPGGLDCGQACWRVADHRADGHSGAAARRLVSSPEMMAGLASLLGVIGVIAGLYGSAEFDIPSGPAIILAGGLLLLGLSFVPRRLTANANVRPHTHQDEVGHDAK